MDPRFIQAHREARWSLALAVAYLAAWGLTAWLGGNTPGITGLPLWFEISCLWVPVLFIVLCAAMIRRVFRDMPLEDVPDER
ncbi:hypothetical protein CIG19_04430 [Enterobacterales bacterium CwR94]|nr:hypothetical protein CIG19_04430 [Enterobacterales bacterium CwR94]